MIPYVLPFCLYLGLTQIPSAIPDHYALGYSLAVVVAGATTITLLWRRRLLRPHGDVAAGILVGIVGILVWIFLCRLGWDEALAGHLPEFLRPGERHGFNPFEELASTAAVWAFISMRLIGLAVLVPVVEELFWRGFLLRWLISPEFERPELWRFTPGSFAAVTVLFTLAHPEWFAAAAYGTLLNGLVYWKRDLWSCIVAHGVSNLILGVYVLTTGSWQLW
jgi:hypothetical protein